MPAFKHILRFALVFLLLMQGNRLSAQTSSSDTRILFLLDCSGSMYAKLDNDIRINAAKRILSAVVDSLRGAKQVEVALRLYGSQSPATMGDCKDTRLAVPFGPSNHDKIIDEIRNIRPKGTTLIAYSLTQAAYDFPDKNKRNIIILITDGIEECKGDPCAVSEALQKQGVSLKPFIIGLGATEDFAKAFQCVGRYYDANSEATFKSTLSAVISQALNNTTAQVNLLDITSKATETDVNMTFYDSRSGRILQNLVHTMNDAGRPDTIFLDPVFTYDIQVHTLPVVWKRGVEVMPGKHNIIPIETPQGALKLQMDGITQYNNLVAVIKPIGYSQTLHHQGINTQQKYIVGNYDVEILTTPRLNFRNVKIDQSTVTTLNIPQPGKVTFVANQGMISDVYRINENTMEWVCKVESSQGRHLVTMQPGTYKVVYRHYMPTRGFSTYEKEFVVTGGVASTVQLY